MTFGNPLSAAGTETLHARQPVGADFKLHNFVSETLSNSTTIATGSQLQSCIITDFDPFPCNLLISFYDF
jgi:hypothetical protein